MRKPVSTTIIVIITVFVLSPMLAHSSQTVVVSPIPGNPIASGQLLLAAVNAISPSASNRYTVKVEAGTYDFVNERLTMKQYVDLEGSGVLNTIIQANGSSSNEEGTIIAAADSEIRDLKVVARNGANNIAIFDGGVSSRVVNVNAVANGGTQCWGIRYHPYDTTAWSIIENSDIYVNCSSYNSGISSNRGNKPTIINTKIRVLGGSEELENVGIFLDNGAMAYRLRDVEIKVGNSTISGIGISCGQMGINLSINNWLDMAEINIQTYGGIGVLTVIPISLKIRHSNIVGNRIAIYYKENYGPSYLQVYHSQLGGTDNTIKATGDLSWGKIGASQLDGGPVSVSPLYATWVKCAAVYDESYTIFNSTCP